MHHTDLCNERFLRHIFAVHKFTAVVHMAAQAGVSQSLVNPLVYVQANIACLTVLLDVLSDHKVKHTLGCTTDSNFNNSLCNFRVPYWCMHHLLVYMDRAVPSHSLLLLLPLLQLTCMLLQR